MPKEGLEALFSRFKEVTGIDFSLIPVDGDNPIVGSEINSDDVNVFDANINVGTFVMGTLYAHSPKLPHENLHKAVLLVKSIMEEQLTDKSKLSILEKQSKSQPKTAGETKGAADKKGGAAHNGKLVECTVLVSNICDFNSVVSGEKPETVINLLNEYFSVMSDVITDHGGTIDKFFGDGIMAVFGAQVFMPESHIHAIATALEMHQGFNRLKRIWQEKGKPVFDQKIGISTGTVIAGNVSSPGFEVFTVIGDAVQISSRILSNANPDSTVISHSTYEKVSAQVRAKALQPIGITGIEGIIRPYEIFALKPLQMVEKSLRKFERYDVALPLTISTTTSKEARHGTMINLSLGGSLFTSEYDFKSGSKVTLTFTIELQETEVLVSGKVVYRKDFKDSLGNVYYHLGVEFDSSAEKQMEVLGEFLEKL
jgi:class 3 adenylate cyclase